MAVTFHKTRDAVHFHDGDLIAVVPLDEWAEATRRLRSMQAWHFVDLRHGTLLTIEPGLQGFAVEGGGLVEAVEVEADVSLARVRIGPVFRALQQFTER